MGRPTAHQSVVTTSDGMAQNECPRKSTGAMPSERRKCAMSPRSPLSTICQTSVTTLTEKTLDAKKMPRRTP
jgi:hypothetical protein